MHGHHDAGIHAAPCTATTQPPNMLAQQHSHSSMIPGNVASTERCRGAHAGRALQHWHVALSENMHCSAWAPMTGKRTTEQPRSQKEIDFMVVDVGAHSGLLQGCHALMVNMQHSAWAPFLATRKRIVE